MSKLFKMQVKGKGSRSYDQNVWKQEKICHMKHNIHTLLLTAYCAKIIAICESF